MSQCWHQMTITMSQNMSDHYTGDLIDYVTNLLGARFSEHWDWRGPGVHIEINPVDGSRYE